MDICSSSLRQLYSIILYDAPLHLVWGLCGGFLQLTGFWGRFHHSPTGWQVQTGPDLHQEMIWGYLYWSSHLKTNDATGITLSRPVLFLFCDLQWEKHKEDRWEKHNRGSSGKFIRAAPQICDKPRLTHVLGNMIQTELLVKVTV